jgi:titin
LSRLTTYYHRIRVKNTYGWGPWTSISFTTTGQVPSAPSDYTSSDVASTTAYFTLPTVADNGGLALISWQYKLNTVASDTGATTSAISEEYIAPFLQGLTPGTTYYFKMLVRNSLGASAYGPWVSFTTRTNVPTPPTSFQVTAITETTATASWAAPADLLGSALWGYSLRFAQNKEFSKGLLEYTREEGELSQALTGLLPGTNYHVQVNAISANGPGSRSPIVSFMTLGTAPSPQDVWLRLAGVWKGGNLLLRVNGVWKPITLWQRINGTWRKN